MKNLITSTLLLLSLTFAACSSNDDGIYVSTSGEGSIIVNNDAPDYLYRMVLFSTDSEQEIYLLGNTAYVDGDANFAGRGAVLKFTIPNQEESSTLQAQSFTIDNDSYAATYSSYVNFSSSTGSEEYIVIDSGTVIIRRSNQFYDIRLLGIDADENNVLAAYRGYIYRWFYTGEGEDLRSM
ncbi:MAG: hypothetical protein R3Y08_08635 [Rikenellaceae bacterium]